MGELTTILIVIMEMVAYVYTNEAFLETKRKKWVTPTILIGTAIKYVSLLGIFGATAESFIVSFFLLVIISLLCYHGSIAERILLTIIFIIVNYSIDSSIVIVNASLFSKTFKELIMEPILYITTSMISKFTLILVAYFLRTKLVSKRKNRKVSFFQMVATTTFSCYTFGNLYLSITEALIYNDFTITLVTNSITSIAFNLLLFYIIDRFEEENELKRSNALLKQQIKMEMAGYTELSNAYSVQRTLTHDFNNHLMLIQSLLSNNSSDKASKYINSVLGKANENIIIFNTNNTIIDALLTQKYFYAKNKGIDVQIMSSDLSVIPIKTEDLVILLLNLIDNAIEAALKCNTEKMMKIKITQDENEIVFSVQNTTILKSEELNKGLVSTKEDKLNHGFGLKIIKSVLKKYGLNYSISIKGIWFRFSFIVNI